MKTTKRRRRRNRRTCNAKATALAVESLEPRMVLSATGLEGPADFGPHGFHHGDRPHHQLEAAAFAVQFYNSGDVRYESAQRFAFDSPPPMQRPNRFPHDAPRGRGNELVRPEGESPRLVDERPNNSFAPRNVPQSQPTSADVSLQPRVIAVISLTLPPTTLSVNLGGGGSTTNGGVASLLSSIPVAASRPANAATTSLITSSSDSLVSNRDSTGTRNGSAAASETSIASRPTDFLVSPAAANSDSYTSLSLNDLTTSWIAQSGDKDGVWNALRSASASAWPAFADRVDGRSPNELPETRSLRAVDEALHLQTDEGGLINIVSSRTETLRDRTGESDETEESPELQRLSKHEAEEAFWFDFADLYLNHSNSDWLLDSTVVDELAGEQARCEAVVADEAWLNDNGGAIVLASSQFTEQAADINAQNSDVASTVDAAPREVAIALEAEVGVFRVIEVATAPADDFARAAVDAGTTEPLADAAAAEAGAAAKPAETAVQSSDDSSPAATRAASLPLLLGFTALFGGRSERRKRRQNRPRRA